MWTWVAEMPKGKPFPEKVSAYFFRRIPFAYLNRKEREFVDSMKETEKEGTGLERNGVRCILSSKSSSDQNDVPISCD
jgi:hypothetical protein